LERIAQRKEHSRVRRRKPSPLIHTKSNPRMVRLKSRPSMALSAHGAIGATNGLLETSDMPQLNTKQGRSYRMLLVVAILVAHKLETWLQDLLAVLRWRAFQDKFSWSRACIIVLSTSGPAKKLVSVEFQGYTTFHKHVFL